MSSRPSNIVLGLLALAAAGAATAKPVSFQDGATLVLDHGPHAQEAQVFAAPHYRYSVGAGWLRVEPEYGADHGAAHDPGADGDAIDIGYLRLNVLAARWNLPASQANVFVWGGLGAADVADRRGAALVPNGGLQLDWETRRLYSALKTDWHSSFGFTHGNSVLQLGVAPYLHDYSGLATWIVAQGHIMEGDVHDEAGGALLLRVFWRWLWVEAGADDAGRAMGLLMLNY